MSDEVNRPGQVSATPEGGPAAEGVPAREPGAGQVQSTPEAAPLSEREELVPPTWQEHMQGPILGTDGLPHGQGQRQEQAAAPPPASVTAAAREDGGVPAGSTTPASASAAAREEDSERGSVSAPSPQDDEQLPAWPPYAGKPVSEVRWDALRYAAPVVAQAEKLTIKAIDLSGRGPSKLARFLETRRQERDPEQERNADGDR